MRFRKSALGVAIASTSLLVGCGDPSVTESASTASIAEPAAVTEIVSEAVLSGEALVNDWMSKLTTEQKVDLLSGVGMALPGVSELPKDVNKVPGAAGYTVKYDELNLHSAVLADGPAGLRIWPQREGDDKTYYATAFPVATVLASSWNPELLESVGNAMGEELRDYGVDVFLAPGMNLHRNPLGGRNFEYYSEDPLITGRSAAAMVNGIESNGVGATIKHYVANNQETNRFLIDTLMSERTLREIYMRGFEIAVKESQPWAIMSSYNKVNGVYVSQHEQLLETVLRDEWGFEGVVMTDWFAGNDAVAQIKAGNDLLMPGMPDRSAALHEAAISGELPIDVIDRSVRRILQMVAKTRSQAGYEYNNTPDLAAHADVARQAAAEGIVLLKNENGALPLAADALNIAAFGRTSYDFIAGGTGSGDVNEAYTVSLVEGLQNAGLTVDSALEDMYRSYIETAKANQPEPKHFFMPKPPVPEMAVDRATIEAAAATSDVALVTLGRNSGEFVDRSVAGDFDLDSAELQMLRDVSEVYRAADKHVVVILNVGNVIETASWRELADAILLPWQGGQEAGNAVADALTGRTTPSGKLATTFPMAYADVPSAKSEQSFPGVRTSDEERIGLGGLSNGFASEVVYTDGIFVGYRYFDSFDVPVAYPFGYGLSYTTFDVQTDPVVIADGDRYAVNVTVTNTGEADGREVVQVYVSAPNGDLPKPKKELRGYAKTALLTPGASETLTIEFSGRDLASFDPTRRAWITDAGEYVVHVGVSSQDLRGTVRLVRDAEVVYDAAIAQLASSRPIDEIKRN